MICKTIVSKTYKCDACGKEEIVTRKVLYPSDAEPDFPLPTIWWKHRRGLQHFCSEKCILTVIPQKELDEIKKLHIARFGCNFGEELK